MQNEIDSAYCLCYSIMWIQTSEQKTVNLGESLGNLGKSYGYLRKETLCTDVASWKRDA